MNVTVFQTVTKSCFVTALLFNVVYVCLFFGYKVVTTTKCRRFLTYITNNSVSIYCYQNQMYFFSALQMFLKFYSQ